MSEASDPHPTGCYCAQCFPFVDRKAYDEIFRRHLELTKELLEKNKQIKNLTDLVGCLQVEIDDLKDSP